MDQAGDLLVELLKSGGPFGAVLLLFVYVAYRFGIWFTPRVDMLVNRHVAFVDESSRLLERLSQSHEKLQAVLEQMHARHEEHAKTLDAIRAALTSKPSRRPVKRIQ